MYRGSRRLRAFTLVEILMVAIILAILAMVVIPQFSDASADVKISALKATLQTVRSQLELYKAQHSGTYPPSATFEAEMCQLNGSFGPYLTLMPINPMDDLSTLGGTQDGSGGWYYKETTGEFRSNDVSVTLGTTKTKNL